MPPDVATAIKPLDFDGFRRIIQAMNRIFRSQQRTAYDRDYARWCAEQGALLREGSLDALDRENLAEEIESLGRSDRREMESRLKVLLVHLLKWMRQPGARGGSWRSTIREQRQRIADLIGESPSLRDHPGKVLVREYGYAVPAAADETGLPQEAFPAECPFSVERVLDPEFLPHAP